MNEISVNISGEEDILYMCQQLREIDRDKAVRSGLNAAGHILVSGGRRRLKERMESGSKGVTGNLLKSFSVKVKRNKPGVLAGFRQGKEGGSHAYWIDRGTTERYQRTRNDKCVGEVTGNLFWWDTESEDLPKAYDAVYLEVKKTVERINNRN